MIQNFKYILLNIFEIYNFKYISNIFAVYFKYILKIFAVYFNNQLNDLFYTFFNTLSQ